MGLVPLKEKTQERSLFLSATWGRGKKTTVWKVGRELSPGTEYGTLILDLQPSELLRNYRLFFKPPGLWHFVIAVQADEDTENI